MDRSILILDGAMGTMLQRQGLSGNNEYLNITHPEVIASIHRKYVEAGADIIETNTFGANAITQAEKGLSEHCYTMALEGAKIARREADRTLDETGRKILVAGSVGPTPKSLTLPTDYCDLTAREYSFDDMEMAYEMQIKGLIDGEVDIILVETCFDALNAKAALYALNRMRNGFPAIVSATVSDSSGRTLTGQTLKSFYDSVKWYGLSAFGINCALGAENMVPLVEEISQFCDVPVICYPNAGLPNANGGYDESPESMASSLQKMSGKVNIIGGCCGTTPEHIAAIREVAQAFDIRQIPSREKPDPIEIPQYPRNLSEAMASGNLDEAMNIVSSLLESGAKTLNVDIDGFATDPCAVMQNFFRYMSMDPSISERATIVVSSSHSDVLLAAFKNTPFPILTALNGTVTTIPELMISGKQANCR